LIHKVGFVRCALFSSLSFLLLPAPDAPQALALLQSLSSQSPRASVPRRLSLYLASGAAFESLIIPYILTALQKGIPSLFSDLKSLYSYPEKQQSIQAYLESLLDAPDEPSIYLWTLYYLAQHHSYLSNHSLALHYLHLAITHTPTLPDLHMFKARVLKRCGDYIGAARAVNEARLLDGQDRFLNTKTGKYLLRTACIDEAHQIFGLFTKVHPKLLTVIPTFSSLSVERCSLAGLRPGRDAVFTISTRGSQCTSYQWQTQPRTQEVYGCRQSI